MADYLARHSGAPEDSPHPTLIKPRIIVLHWTGSGSLDAAWNTFEPARLAGRPDLQGAGAVNVSAHFLVDRDGSAFQLLPVDRAARHVIGLNHLAIGIENVGDGAKFPLTAAQVETNARIVRWLAASYPITHLIGHHEYREMEGTEFFRESDSGYRTTKTDPGDTFVSAVHEKVSDLWLQRATAAIKPIQSSGGQRR